jgi:hypothetical protein
MTRSATPAATAGEVRQPLSGMILNAAAGLHWLERSTPDIDEAKAAFRQIMADSLRAAAVIESITGELQECSASRQTRRRRGQNVLPTGFQEPGATAA